MCSDGRRLEKQVVTVSDSTTLPDTQKHSVVFHEAITLLENNADLYIAG